MLWYSIVAAVGCSNGQKPSEDEVDLGRQFMLDMAQPDMVLHTRLVSPTVRLGDPIGLLVIVTNPAKPRPFSNDPALFGYRVETESGDVVDVHPVGLSNHRWGAVPYMTLPAQSALVNLVDLSCLYPRYHNSESQVCEYKLAIEEPGRYRVITTYQRGAPGLVRSPFERDGLADTVSLEVR